VIRVRPAWLASQANTHFSCPFFLLRQKVRISTSSEGGSCGEQGSARSVTVRMCDPRTGRTSWSTPFSPFFACDTIAARIVTRGFWVDIRLTRASKPTLRIIVRIIVPARSPFRGWHVSAPAVVISPATSCLCTRNDGLTTTSHCNRF
jgi:hypothetical protein